jgi:hypothetical protein
MDGPLSVAGKAEKMTSVVNELMHIHATNQRGRTLFSADEIDGQHEKQTAEDRPGEHISDRDGYRLSGGGKCCGCHMKLLGFRVPFEICVITSEV